MDSTDDINNTENCTDYTTQLHNYKTVQLHWVVLFHWLQWPHCVLHNGNSDYTNCINFTLCLHCNGKTIINFGSPIQSSNTMRLIKWFLLIWSITPTTSIPSTLNYTNCTDYIHYMSTLTTSTTPTSPTTPTTLTGNSDYIDTEYTAHPTWPLHSTTKTNLTTVTTWLQWLLLPHQLQ